MSRPKQFAAATVILSVAAPAQVPLVSHKPPVSTSQPVAKLVTWRVSPARCEGRDIKAVRPPEPLSGAVYVYDDGRPGGPARFRLSIDATGRPTGIRPVSNPYLLDSADLGPSLAASAFPAQAPQSFCEIEFTPSWTAFDVADREAVIGYTLLPVTDPPRDAWRWARPTDTTCFDPQPQALVSRFPDFQDFDQSPGTMSWTMVGFDTNRRGRPERVDVAASSGNAAFDRASVAALKRSRFAEGERRGCLFPYVRRGEPLAAPEMPEPGSLRPARADCPESVPGMQRPAHEFPAAYGRRGIEGWAVIGFDVAPWGEVGNARVLAAEPAAEFGTTALGLARATRLPAAGRGYTGCVQRFRFSMKRGEAHDRERPGDAPLTISSR